VIREDDPLSALVEIAQTMEMERDSWRVALATSTSFRATASEYHAEITASARLGGREVWSKRWSLAAKRDFGD